MKLITFYIEGRLKLEVSTVLVLLAVAIENVHLLVRQLQFTNDSRWSKVSVQHHRDTNLSVLLPCQLLTSVLEGRALGVVANLETSVSFHHDLAVLVALLVTRAE